MLDNIKNKGTLISLVFIKIEICMDNKGDIEMLSIFQISFF